MSATEFKAKCLAVLDRVHTHHESVVITKHGRIVARLVPDGGLEDKPWMRLRGLAVRWTGDPFAPAVADADIEAVK